MAQVLVWMGASACAMCACMYVRMLSVLYLKGVARHNKSQRLLARPAAGWGLHVSVSEVVHCALCSLIEEILCLLKWNVPMVPPSLPQVLYTETFPWRMRMFTGFWLIYSSLMGLNTTRDLVAGEPDGGYFEIILFSFLFNPDFTTKV